MDNNNTTAVVTGAAGDGSFTPLIAPTGPGTTGLENRTSGQPGSSPAPSTGDLPTPSPAPSTPAKKRDWKTARTVRLLTLSPTQIETYDLCKRKWWLKSVRKLPDKTTKSQAFGTVLHAVVERFLSGDALGRDAKGNPVDLYPEGWTHARNRYTGESEGEVTPAEASTVKTLITQAIENGVLSRPVTEFTLEAPFTETLEKLPCPRCKDILPQGPCNICGAKHGEEHNAETHEEVAESLFNDPDGTPEKISEILNPTPWVCEECGGDGKGDHVQVTGYIDFLQPDEVQDHKTTSGMKWAKSKEGLRENVQMLIYARVLLFLREKAQQDDPEKITLRHNVYCKDPNDLRVKKTEVMVTPEEVRGYWENLRHKARDMAALRRRANSWKDCPDPANFAHSCNAYGGCPFRMICTGKETEEMYEKRLDSQKESGHNFLYNQTGNISNNPQERKPTMSLADRMRARMSPALNGAAAGAVTATAPTPTAPTPTAPAAPQPAPVAQAAPAPVAAPAAIVASANADAPPWANPACRACHGNGFNTAGNACRICDVVATQRQTVGSSGYELTPIEGNLIYWKSKAQPGLEGASPLPANVTAPAAPAPLPQIITPANNPLTQTQAAPPAPQVTPAAPAPQAADAPGRGRPRKGFTLVLNAHVTRGAGNKVNRLVDVFQNLQVEMATAAGVGYYEMDAFKRRDTMAQFAEKIADSLGTDMVVADIANGTPDFKALVEAIRPYASIEIAGG